MENTNLLNDRKEFYEVEMLPLMAECISRRKNMYGTINSIYKKNKLEYIQSGKESKYNDYFMLVTGDFEQRIYYKKCMAILENEKIGFINLELVIHELKKEFPYAYNAVSVKKINKMSIYLELFKKRYGNNCLVDQLTDNFLAFIIFLRYLDFDIDTTDVIYQSYIMSRIELINLSRKKPDIKINGSDYKIIERRYEEIQKKLNFKTSSYIKECYISDENGYFENYINAYTLSLYKI